MIEKKTLLPFSGRRGRLLRLLLPIALLLILLTSAYAMAEEPMVNRYNVAIVVDSSESMRTSDPMNYRFEAISQFVNLLTERGNYVGAVVFSTDLRLQKEVEELDAQSKKDALISSVMGISPGGYTNIGAALTEAVRMLDKGDPKLPSVILILSDGYTDMPTQDGIDASLEAKAEALQAAREKSISIYSICLTSGGEVDVAEMRQLADATGGVFREVKSADDLSAVFNSFHNMILGSASVDILNGEFPDSGVLETEFEVPGIGVEEINILIFGNASSQTLIRPDGAVSGDAFVVDSWTYSLIKESQVMPGVWTLRTTGVPGDRIRVSMVYNTNLIIDVGAQPEEPYINPADPLVVSASLRAGDQTATRPEQFTGYTAELVVADAYRNEIDTAPMAVNVDHFEAEYHFPGEGKYYYYVRVKGNYIEKASAVCGPLDVNPDVPTRRQQESDPEAVKYVPPVNHAPEPVQDPVEYTVNVWPFRQNVLEFTMAGLAKDSDGDPLRYRLESSSFIEGTDYTVRGETIRMEHYSLRKGAFTVSATDNGGLSCSVEVIVKAHDIGMMTLIGLGIAAVLAAIIIAIVTYILLTRPFLGTITCSAGPGRGTPIRGRRGQLKLTVFRLPETGIDYGKCKFQATGKNYVFLITNKPVYCGGKAMTKVQINNGQTVEVRASATETRTLRVKFDSLMKTRRHVGGTGGGASKYARNSAAAAKQGRKF